MTTQYEIVEHIIELGDRVPLTPVALPAGWVPLSVIRREGRVVVLMTREIGSPPDATGAPVLTTLTPNTLAAGGTPATIDVVGSSFDPSCVVKADAVPRSTFYLDATHLQYTARPDLEDPGQVSITVTNGSGTSSALLFTFT